MESGCRGRRVSNRGGWQSKDLVANPDPALAQLVQVAQEPLARYIWGRRKGEAPDGVDAQGGCCVSAVADELWANVNRPGNYNARHSHGSETASLVASCVFYPTPEAGEAPAPIVLFPPGEEPVRIAPRAGTLLLFPPDLPHEVLPVADGSGTRVSVAFNLRARWLDHPLLQAAAAGQPDDVASLVAEGADVDRRDAHLGLGPAHLAAEAGHVPVLEALLQNGADLGALSREGWSPLGLAADRGQAGAVELLRDLGAFGKPRLRSQLDEDKDLPQTGYAGREGARDVAAERGHLSVVELLIGDGTGGVALSMAARSGHAEVVEYLLGEGFKPNPEKGSRPIHDAASSGHAAVAELLVGAGADLDARDKGGKCAGHIAATSGHLPVMELLTKAAAEGRWDVNACDKDGARPLHWAAGQGHAAMVEHLVAAGADPEAASGGAVQGQAIHWAASDGHVEVVEQLLMLGADPDAGGQGVDAPPMSSPHIFTRYGDVWRRIHASEVLTRRKVNAEAADEGRASAPLHVAARAGHLAIAEVLGRYGAPVASRDSNGGVPLHWAAANGHAALVKYLLAEGADADARDGAGSCPLHDATWSGHRAVAEELLGSGALLQADKAGRTPLHAAAILSQDNIAKMLVAAGAEAGQPDAAGRSAADLAAEAEKIMAVLGKKAGYGKEMLQRAQRVSAVLKGASA